MSEKEWHALSAQEVLKKLSTDKNRGLSSVEVNNRLEKFGPNTLQEEKKSRLLKLITDQFKDVFVIMLLFASGLSYMVGELTDAILIAVIVVLCVVTGFVQEYRSEKALEAMKRMTAPTARVFRDGKEATVPAKDVVPGDILLLETGDRVAADARLLENASLKTDEAPLTGESTPVEKSLEALNAKTPVADRKNFVFMGTHTVFGRGKAVVTFTGMNTEFGKIAGAVQAIEEEKTPLKSKLDVFAKKLGRIIVAICVLIFVLNLVRWGIGFESIRVGSMTAIALAVSAVPEALPALVIVTLALGARELAKRNAVVRKLASAETLGSTTVICADKTGTLTKGEMTVRKLYTNNQMVEVTGVGYGSKGEFHLGGNNVNPQEDEHLKMLLRVGTLCNNARYDGQRISGDPTEGALIVAAAKPGMQRERLEEQYPRVWEVPFSSERKRMTTIHITSDGDKVAYMKGAPEVVLERCTHIFEDGRVKKLSENKRNAILRVNEKMASEALRVLGMAYAKLPDTMEHFPEEKVEKNLVFVGLEGMIDPPREEVFEAVKLCKKAGIKNIMITGDHKLTAVAIAREIGTMKKGDIALTGVELDKLSDEEYNEIVEKVVVYARVSPMHKRKIIDALKKKGEIVAMTGDGVNDAPALKMADIGVAMGITGTDVSKEAADMVLADDNYATLVNAVKRGRSIYDNIRTYLRFLLSCNFDELTLITVWSLAGFPLPLLATQILFINLLTDGPPAIALSVDPPEPGIMERPPRDPKAGVFHGMLAFVLASFIAQTVGSSLTFAYGIFVVHDVQVARTMTFMQASLRELLKVWNCRSETHSVWRMGRFAFRNRFFVVATIACTLLQVVLPYVPVINSAFNLVVPTLDQWLVILFVASWGLVIVLPEIFMGRKVPLLGK